MKATFVLLALAASSLAYGQSAHQHQGRHQPEGHRGQGGHQHGGAPAAQGVISLDVYADRGVIYLLTAEQSGESVSLWFRRSKDGGGSWTPPVRVDGKGRPPRAMRRGDDAQIAAHGETVLALWAVPGSGWGGSGPFSSALSRDGGKTWTPAGNPSDSGRKTGHGFADLLYERGEFHVAWLDSRQPKRQGLRYARSKNGMRWSSNETVEEPTCECCWNSLHAGGGKLHVLYRAKDPRDMALATRSDAAGARDGTPWERRGRVGAFDWQVRGCPETGGALAATDDDVLHALVWTGQEGAEGLHHLRSAGGTWSPPVRLGSQDAGHSDLAARGRRLAAVWDENGAVYAGLSYDAGVTWSPPQRLSVPPADATHPRVVSAGEGFLVLWSERGANGRHELRTQALR